MSVLVVGISHNSAPVALLEQVAPDADGVPKLVQKAAASEHVTEATVISTCNRVEIYAEVDRFHGSVEELSMLLVERAGGSTEAMLPHLYVHYDDGAVSHLFQVAAGLDSMAVGEGQILGQTREALQLGQELGTVGPALNVLFQQALRVGKRSRAETDIDQVAPTLVGAALDRSWGDAGPGTSPVAGRRVLVVGAGAMAGLATAMVTRLGAARVIVANRTPGAGRPPRRGVRSPCPPPWPTSRPPSPRPTWSSPARAHRVSSSRSRWWRMPSQPWWDRPRAAWPSSILRSRTTWTPRSPNWPGSPVSTWATSRTSCTSPRPGARSTRSVGSSRRRSARSCRPAARPASPRRLSPCARWPPASSTPRCHASPAGCPTSTTRPGPRSCRPCAGSPTSCFTSRPSGSRSSSTRRVRCRTPPRSPSCSPSTPTRSTRSPGRRACA